MNLLEPMKEIHNFLQRWC